MSDAATTAVQDDELNQPIRDARAAADRASAEAKEAKAEAEGMKRENAFLKAGVNTESGVGKLLFDGYKGEVTPDAIREAAAEYGIGPKPEGSDAEEVQTVDAAAAAQRDLLTAGGSQADAPPPPVNRQRQALRDFDTARREGVPRDQAAIAYIGEAITGAIEGDMDFRWDEAEHYRKGREYREQVEAQMRANG